MTDHTQQVAALRERIETIIAQYSDAKVQEQRQGFWSCEADSLHRTMIAELDALAALASAPPAEIPKREDCEAALNLFVGLAKLAAVSDDEQGLVTIAAKTLRQLIAASSAPAAAEGTPTLTEWVPTVANINMLPDPLRKYIHDLETNADPSGMVRENAIARDTIRALELQLVELRSSPPAPTPSEPTTPAPSPEPRT